MGRSKSQKFVLGAALWAVFVLSAGGVEAKPPLPDPSEFKVGQATASDVIDRYGRPNSDTQMSDGSRAIAYIRVHTHVKGATWVPVVGLFAGGATGGTDMVVFVFGSDGKLKTTNSTMTQVDCSTMGHCQ